MRPIKDDVDDFFWFYFRCNSTLENEGTLYNVDCMPALDLSDDYHGISRREDATMQCPKTMQYPPYRAGVSIMIFLLIKVILLRVLTLRKY